MKIRTDFVSNSSSSSFIVSSNYKPREFNRKTLLANIGIPFGEETFHYFDNFTCLVMYTLDAGWDDINQTYTKWSFFRGGTAISNDGLSKFFNDDDTVKDDLTFEDVEESIAFDDVSGDFPDESLKCVCSKVTKKTVNFNKWLIEKFVENLGDDIFTNNTANECIEAARKSLDKVSEALENGKEVYYIYENHEGDGTDYGKYYLDFNQKPETKNHENWFVLSKAAEKVLVYEY